MLVLMRILNKTSELLYLIAFLGSFLAMQLYGMANVMAAEQGDPVTSVFDMRANGIDYRIFVAAPKTAENGKPMPVIYMIDGNSTFPMAVDVVKKRPQLRALIVGIGYPTQSREDIVRSRYYDLTPETPAELIPSRGNGADLPRTGGNAAFLNFIEQQVKPEIERRFAVDKNNQTLFGHSLGGLFTLHALFSERGHFQTYSAADPSVWWNNRSILKEKDRFIKQATETVKPVKVLIETAGKSVMREGVDKDRAAQLKALRGGPNGRDIYQELVTLPAVSASFHQFSGESHGSMLPYAVEDMLRFVLEDVKPVQPPE